MSLQFWKFFKEQNHYDIFTLYNLNACIKIYDFILANIDKIHEVYKNLADASSKEAYLAVLCERVSGVITDLKCSEAVQYFHDCCMPETGDVVFDCGSYDGQTAVEFSQLGCKVYSFELDKINYQKGIAKAEKYQFILENLGVGAARGQVHYSAGDAASSIQTQGNAVGEIIDIDTYVNEKDISKVDFIKMDVEGAELQALSGARASIGKFKPKLAICTYHKLPDLWEIPLYIKSIRSDYVFYFRHHMIDLRFDYLFKEEELNLLRKYKLDHKVKSWCEHVLYCK